MEVVKEKLNIDINYANAGDHVPEAERNNRTIKERFRAAFHRLPFKAMPRIMIRYLAMDCTSKLNLFPVKGGISDYYSPRTILNHRVVDYTKECLVPFGTFVQANNEKIPSNTNAPRTLDAIYLRPTQNLQHGHELMDLNSGMLITRSRMTEIPITDRIIEAVNQMGYQQGFPKDGLKLKK